MEHGRVLEVPDMADRLARPNCDASSSQQNMEYPSERYACQQSDPCGKDITVSSSYSDGTEIILRHAESAGSLSYSLDDECHEFSSLSTRSGIGQTGVSTDRRESMEAVGCHKKSLNMSFLTRCRNVRGKLGLEQVSEDNESLVHSGSSKSCGNSSPAKSAKHPESGCIIEIPQTENVLQDENNSRNYGAKRKDIDFCHDSQPKLHETSRALPADISQGSVRQKRLAGNGDISPCNIEGNMKHSKFQCQQAMVPPNAGIIDDQYNWKEVDLSASGHKIKQRRLVQDGYISQNENTDYKTNKKLKEDKIENTVSKEMPDGPITVSSKTENIDLDCCGRYEAAKKEKTSANDHLINEPHNKYVSQLGRPYKRAEENMTIIGQSQSNDNIWTVENLGWRKIQNRTGETSIISSSQAINIEKIEASQKQGARNFLNNALGNSERISVSELDSSKKQSASMLELKRRSKSPNKRGRKCILMFNSHGKCTSSVFNDSEVLYQRTSTSSRNQTYQHCSTLLDPIIKVNELHPPEATFNAPPEQSLRIPYGSRAKDRQIESDGLFAHQLQEQMFNESQEIGIRKEIDAALALSLQQEEHAQYVSSDSRQDRQNAGNRLVARPHSPLSSKFPKIMRVISFRRMNKDERLDFREKLEAAFDNDNTMPVSYIHQPVSHIRQPVSHFHQPVSHIHQRNFSENNEMLLSIDENHHQSSNASEIQINTLPQSVVQTDNVEVCVICLDKPSVGDIIRHLPCLHKFHKDCIDEWLRQKTTCPTCKLQDFLITSARLS